MNVAASCESFISALRGCVWRSGSRRAWGQVLEEENQGIGDKVALGVYARHCGTDSLLNAVMGTSDQGRWNC